MSYRVKMILPVVGMILLFGYAALAVVRSNDREIKQPLPPSMDNLAAVKLVQIRDAGGQVVLSGNFTTFTTKKGGIEGVATLASTGIDSDALGKAEIEISNKKNGVVEKEFEVEVENLAANTTYNLIVDGQQATTFSTNHRGKAELELSNRPSK